MMIRTRSTITTLMVLVLGVGLGLAALRNADPALSRLVAGNREAGDQSRD
jgi:hypothetical protein